MQIGNRLYPTPEQANTLLRWIGCQRFIYNAKVSEDRYFRAYARKFASYERVPIDQEYSRFIGPDTEWLRAVPSQVLRNGAVRWREAFQRFFRKLAGHPKFKKAHGEQSVWLTSELFRFIETVHGEFFPAGRHSPMSGRRAVVYRSSPARHSGLYSYRRACRPLVRFVFI